MSQSDAVQQAATRLDAAVEGLAKSLNEFLEDIQSVASLKEQLRTLTNERDRLLTELEDERGRTRRLEAANDEVSDRLEALTGTLKTMTPANRGGAGLEF
jgi:chromosome segregation ATPase